MKAAIVGWVALVVLGPSAWAFTGPYQKYVCTLGNPFRHGVSNQFRFEVSGSTESQTDVIYGVFKGVDFRFEATPKTKNGVAVWKDRSTGMILSVQIPDAYEGVQDELWGQMTLGAVRKKVTCFRGR